MSALISIGRIGSQVRPVVARSVWTNVYGVGRTLLALGSLGTVLFSSTTSLFTPAQGLPAAPYCTGIVRATIYCLSPSGNLELARWVSVGILVVVIAGWRPRWTALPHWWVTFSLATAQTIPDGGDQIAMNMTLLLLPIALTDSRRWHWQSASPDVSERHLTASLIAWSASFVIRVQVAALYFQSCVAKLSHDEWADGTALYYWMSDSLFGLPRWAEGFLRPVLLKPWGVQALTWGPLVIEFALFAGLFARREVRPWLLAVGLAFHTGIGLLMGLWSFAFAMFGCLVLHLRPLDTPFAPRLTTVLGRRLALLLSPPGRSLSGVRAPAVGVEQGHAR